MDSLILEIHTQGLHQYHVIDKARTRIGRAFDNDIILSEPTVAPYHLEITRDNEGNFELHNLAKVNPSSFNGVAVETMAAEILPINIKLGRVMARIVAPDHGIADTKTLAGNGHSKHLFSHAIWGVLLIVLCLLTSSVEYYTHSFTTLKWDALARFVARETAVYLAALIFILSILERLIINRWEIKPLVVVVSLTYLLFQLISPVIEELSYVFSSGLPESIFEIFWYVIFIPVVASLYLVHINHQRPGKSIGLAILFCSPLIILSAIELTQMAGLLDTFSTSANYHKDLSALNWHSDETISITSFLDQAKTLSPGKISD